MADPRLAVSYDEIGAVPVSYLIDDSTITYSATADGGSSQVGLAVKLSDSDTIALAGAGERVHGKLLGVEPDGVATVQVKGYMTFLQGDNVSTPVVGEKIQGDTLSAADGYVKDVAATTAEADGYIVNVGTSDLVVLL